MHPKCTYVGGATTGCVAVLCAMNIMCILFIDITYFVQKLYISEIPDALLCGAVVYDMSFWRKQDVFVVVFVIYEQNGRTLL